MNGHLAMRRVAVLLGALCLVLVLWYLMVRPTYLRVAVGPAGSSHAAYVQGIAKVLKDTRQPYRFILVPVAGTAEASELLDKGSVDLAVLRSDDLESKDARSIVVLHKRAVIFVTRKPPPAEKIEKPVMAGSAEADARGDKEEKDDGAGLTLRDVEGKRIGIVNVDTDSYRPIIERILSHYDVDADEVKIREMNRAEVTKAMAAGELDGFVVVANPASKPTRGVISDLTGTHKLALVVKGVPAHEALALRFRELITTEIPEGIFGGKPLQPGEYDTKSVAVTVELTATPRLSDQSATALTKSLMEIRARLRSGQDSSYAIEIPPVDEDRRYLPHAGTAAFINSEAKTLFETYSDHIWLGLFAIGIIGSSVAGVLSWAGLKREAPADTLAERMRVLAGRLEAASSVADVDAVQGDFDDLVLSIMREYGLRGLVDEGTPDPSPWLHTFAGLIARRRMLLSELGPGPNSARPVSAGRTESGS